MSLAGIKHDIIRNKESVTLRCPLPVEGTVTWSRENKGRIVDILTADGNSERRLIDDTRFMSSADKWLIILRPAASDSGRYLCNNKPAVQLTVISPGNVTLCHCCSVCVCFQRSGSLQGLWELNSTSAHLHHFNGLNNSPAHRWHSRGQSLTKIK